MHAEEKRILSTFRHRRTRRYAPNFIDEGQNAPSKAAKGGKSKTEEKKKDSEANETNSSEEDEGNMSKLDYELSSYSDLLAKASEPVRGQVSTPPFAFHDDDLTYFFQ